jgi:heterodisulfide reductase subunit B
MGLALGLDRSVLGLDRHLVSPEKVLSHLGS